jgi:hypothetical protein
MKSLDKIISGIDLNKISKTDEDWIEKEFDNAFDCKKWKQKKSEKKR